MKFNTGKFLNDRTEIMLGDKLQGEHTHEVVVLWDNVSQNHIVQVIGIPDSCFLLDEFLLDWKNNIAKTGNMFEIN